MVARRSASGSAPLERNAAARDVGEPVAVLLDDAVPGDAEAGVDAQDSNRAQLERPRVHARVRKLAAHVAPALAQDPLELRSRSSRHAAGWRRLRASEVISTRRAPSRAANSTSATAPPVPMPWRAQGRADPVADLELRDGPSRWCAAHPCRRARRRPRERSRNRASSRECHLACASRQCFSDSSSGLRPAATTASTNFNSGKRLPRPPRFTAAPWPERVARQHEPLVWSSSGTSRRSACR